VKLRIEQKSKEAVSTVLAAFFISRKGVLTMNNQEARKPRRKTITIQGRKVTLCFAEHPNLKVAEQVKQALLNGYEHRKSTLNKR